MSRPQMLTEMCTDERAWCASTVDEPISWHYSLSEDCLSAFDELIQSFWRKCRPATKISIHESLFDTPTGAGVSIRSACIECFQPVLTALNAGRGFAIVEGVPVEQSTVGEAQAIYWVIGQFLGVPFEQNIEGTLLYDVRDIGGDVAQGARFSVTNSESSFHVDSAYGNPMPDFVGLLCLHGAKSGGQSQLISAYAIYNELLENYADVLETLYGLFYFDRRGQFKEGESPTSQFPIFRWDGWELTIRYIHYYIQVGHQRESHALTTDQKKALGIMETLLHHPDFRVEFSLQPGQILFTNNHWILHNRTAFEDYLEPDLRRHYVRLWLKRQS